MNYVIKCMFPAEGHLNGRIGTYYHLFPTYAQGKKIIWDGRTDPDSRGYSQAFLDYFPKELFPPKMRNETELRIEAINGSAYQIVGTDKLDAIVGTNQVACIFSEYSLQNPKARDILMPILVQNNGWAWFIYTPRGRNHGWDLWDITKGNKRWYRRLLTITDTKREDGSPVITDEKVQQEIADGADPAMARQEYYCSFDIGVVGSYYSHLIERAESENRMRCPFETRLPVDTWWDIGKSDSTAIWFTQQIGKEIRVIDYYENSGEGLPFYAAVIADRRMSKGYVYGSFNFPWDMAVTEYSTGKTRIEQAHSLGLKPSRIVRKLSIEDGIAAVRAIIPKCWFNADNESVKQGIKSLRDYHKEYNEQDKRFFNTPHKDWTNHGADAFRYMSVGIREDVDRKRPEMAETSFDVFSYNRQDNIFKQTEAETEYSIWRHR